jgi:hypothetical protein
VLPGAPGSDDEVAAMFTAIGKLCLNLLPSLRSAPMEIVDVHQKCRAQQLTCLAVNLMYIIKFQLAVCESASH